MQHIIPDALPRVMIIPPNAKRQSPISPLLGFVDRLKKADPAETSTPLVSILFPRKNRPRQG